MEDEVQPCATRDVLDRIGDAWSVMIVLNLSAAPSRFSQLRRQIGSISQRMLSVTLRHLERDGLVSRTVFPTVPPSVEYALTERGHSLASVLDIVSSWAIKNGPAIAVSRQAYDLKAVADRGAAAACGQQKFPAP